MGGEVCAAGLELTVLPKIRHLEPILARLARRGLRVAVVDTAGGQYLRSAATTVAVYGAAEGCRDLWNFRSLANPRHAHGYPNGTRDLFVAQLADVLRGGGMACCDAPR
jgi:hypothetical protein